MKNEQLQSIAKKALWKLAEASSTPHVLKEQIRTALLNPNEDYHRILSNIQNSNREVRK